MYCEFNWFFSDKVDIPMKILIIQGATMIHTITEAIEIPTIEILTGMIDTVVGGITRWPYLYQTN